MVSRFDFNNEGNDRRKGIKNTKKEQVSGAKKNNPNKKKSEGKTTEKKAGTLIFPKKNEFSFRIIFYAALLVVTLYLVFCVYKYINSKNISTYQVKEGALSEQNSYTGLILREEEVYYAKSSGYYNFYLKEGEKASHTDLVYSIDGSGKIKEMMTNQTEDATTLTEDDLNEIKSEIVKFSKEYDQNDYIDVYDFKDEIDSISLKMSNLYILNKISSMSLNGTNVNKYYCADGMENAKTGYVVYYYDNYEDLKPEDIDSSYFADDIDYKRNMIANNEIVSEGDFAYKLVTSNTWELVFPIEEEKAKEFDGKEMKVKFLKNQETLKGKVKIIDAIAPGKKGGCLSAKPSTLLG